MHTMQIKMNRLLSLEVKIRFLHANVHYEQKHSHSMF